MFFKKKSAAVLAVIMCICIIAVAVADKNNTVPVSSEPLTQPKFIIDAGHGGLTNTTF